ncbi:glycosyltransferase family 2 protein [Methylacidiphilum caldifontis]|uniref:glycosyltransferase family 2 protein n=1 Tax=Methylacidiphilum caldifontis TaxID=2795386 RepID=UPI001A900C62|nr:glycosyltransferase family 2 protein [Methylacidiphilum caldifontis]QSR88261.1 glycosyltransferase family 2 protein [Methylacidiphilum caldifontis]
MTEKTIINNLIDWSIIIVSFQSKKVIKNSLEALFSQKGTQIEIFVVDNNSTDGTQDILQEFSDRITVICNPINVGFSRAANLPLDRAKGRFVLFLNPDVMIKNPYFLKKMAHLFEEEKKVGAIGPSLYYPDGKIQPSMSLTYPNQKWAMSSLPVYPGKIAALLGACLAIRKEILEELGGFDEDFFLYGEDQDLCLRIRKLGFSLAYCPQIQAFHIGGHSTENISAQLLWERKLQAEYIFYNKHYSKRAIDRIALIQLIKSHWELFLLSSLGSAILTPSKLNEKKCKYKAIRSQALAHLFSKQQEKN